MRKVMFSMTAFCVLSVLLPAGTNGQPAKPAKPDSLAASISITPKAQRKLERDLRRSESWAALKSPLREGPSLRKKGEVLVRYKKGVNPSARAKSAWVARSRKVNENVALLEFEETRKDFDALKLEIAKDPEVESVEPNLQMEAQADDSKRDYRGSQKVMTRWKEKLRVLRSREGMQPQEDASRVRLLAPGKGKKKIRVGILDTGIDWNHPDLAKSARRGVNLIYQKPLLPMENDEESDSTEMDYNGHGTLMAGLIAAESNDFGIDGINDDCVVIGIKALDESGLGSLDKVIAGIQWASENGIDILNMSFGTYIHSPIFEAAVKAAVDKGMILVASAGNDFSGQTMYPARFPGVLSVGSLEADGSLSKFTNWGEDVDLFGFGGSVLSTTTGKVGGDGYSLLSGTSVASAHCTGLASLLAASGKSASDVERIFRLSGIKYHLEAVPDGKPVLGLNAEKILADLDNSSLKDLGITRLKDAPLPYSGTDRHKISVGVQNTGNSDLPPQPLSLVFEWDNGDSAVAIANLPSLKPGQESFHEFTLETRNLVGKQALMNGKQINISVRAAVGLSDLRDESPLLQIIGAERELPIGVYQSMWVTPMEFTSKRPDRMLHIKMANAGNHPLRGLTLKPVSRAAVHEGVGLVPAIPMGPDFAVPDLAPGESKILDVPIPDFTPPLYEVTLEAEFYHAGALAGKIDVSYVYSHGNDVKVQYAQDVHRAIADQAAELLYQQGIYIPDLHGAGQPFRGNPAAGNSGLWPISCYVPLPVVGEICLPQASITRTGYWTDAIMSNQVIIPDVSIGIVPTLTAGASNCDDVDIVYGYSTKHTFNSHYWLVDVSDDRGLLHDYNFATGQFSGSADHSALTKARALLFGKSTFSNNVSTMDSKLEYGAINHYQAGHKKAAWWFVGHAVHLMGDVTLGAHVNEDNAHGGWGDPYHNWMDAGNYTRWNWSHAKNKGGLIDPYQSANAGDPVRFLYYTAAQLGNRFPWAHTKDGTDFGAGGNKTAGGQNPHYDAYMTTLYNSLPSHPMSRWQINKEEVTDACAWKSITCVCCTECQLVDWAGANETHTDCYDRNGHVDRDNTDNNGSNSDGDLNIIGDAAYTYAIRAAAGLIYYFAQETGQFNYRAIPAVNLVLLD